MENYLENVISDLDRKLIAAHRYDKSLFEELTRLQLEKGITHGTRPISPFLRPHFLARSIYRDVQLAAHHLHAAFERLTAAALEYPEIMAMLGLSEAEERFARYEPGYGSVSVTSRLDTFLSSGEFKFLEYNAETPAGVGDQAVLADIVTRVPEVQAFLSEHHNHLPIPHASLAEALLIAYREYGGRNRTPHVAIVDWVGVDTSGEFEILHEYFESRGLPTVICDPGELEYDGKRLRRGSFEIDIFYKRVIIHEFLERCDDRHPVARAVADGAVCMANSFRSKIPHKKAGFAVLTDVEFARLFTSPQLEAIRKHIPWTRRVRDGETTFGGEKADLLELIRKQRYRFLLKPNDDYGGKGIVFGWESSESEWDSAVETALNADYVVQERADVEKTSIPMFYDGEARIESLTVDLDPYLFMGKVEGAMVRLAAGSLVNITQGGGEAALVVLEGF